MRKDTLLYEMCEQGKLEPLTEDETVDEIVLFVENLDCHSYLISDQMSNLLFEVEGQLPDEKEKILESISLYQQKSLMEKLEFRLKRRLQYYMVTHGLPDQNLHQIITETLDAIQSESPDAEERTNQSIAALKQGFI